MKVGPHGALQSSLVAAVRASTLRPPLEAHCPTARRLRAARPTEPAVGPAVIDQRLHTSVNIWRKQKPICQRTMLRAAGSPEHRADRAGGIRGNTQRAASRPSIERGIGGVSEGWGECDPP